MKDKRCFVCKFQGKISLDTFQNVIYQPRDKNFSISLCYGHSVELFKMGQTTFMLKYKQDFNQYIGVEDDSRTLSFFTQG